MTGSPQKLFSFSIIVIVFVPRLCSGTFDKRIFCTLSLHNLGTSSICALRFRSKSLGKIIGFYSTAVGNHIFYPSTVNNLGNVNNFNMIDILWCWYCNFLKSQINFLLLNPLSLNFNLWMCMYLPTLHYLTIFSYRVSTNYSMNLTY